MNQIRFLSSVLACALIVDATNSAARAQPAPATFPSPATLPTSAPAAPERPRYVMTMPPGFHKVESGFRVALCEPADDAWVKRALSDTPPTTMPTTMPADVVDRLKDRRE